MNLQNIYFCFFSHDHWNQLYWFFALSSLTCCSNYLRQHVIMWTLITPYYKPITKCTYSNSPLIYPNGISAFMYWTYRCIWLNRYISPFAQMGSCTHIYVQLLCMYIEWFCVIQRGPAKTQKSWIYLYASNYHSMQIDNFVLDCIAVNFVYHTHG